MTIKRRTFVKRPKRNTAAGRTIEHGPPTYSALHGFCDRCDRLCRYPEEEYHNLCGYCNRGDPSR